MMIHNTSSNTLSVQAPLEIHEMRYNQLLLLLPLASCFLNFLSLLYFCYYYELLNTVNKRIKSYTILYYTIYFFLKKWFN